jgi:hypothetical protein
MDAALEPPSIAPRFPRLAASPEAVRRATLFLMIFGGSMTMFEPGPYEFFGAIAILVWSAGGLRIRREMIPILFLVFLYMTGALLTLIQVLDRPKTVMWTVVSWYLVVTGLFFMMALVDRTAERMEVISRAMIATAVLCAALGVLGYFGLVPGSESLMRFDRAKSTFEDPNVFAPFLIFPALLLIQHIYLGPISRAPLRLAMLLVLLAGIFLSFSRGSWGHLVLSTVLMTFATLVCARSHALKLRIVVLWVVGLLLAAGLLSALLSVESVNDLFSQRASLEQNYDVGEFGRFHRHILGFLLVLSRPFGIGMLQFWRLYGEDPHNTYLNAFLSYGWIGGVTWPAIVIMTLYAGWRYCLLPSPWRPAFICAVATYSGVVVEAWVIDIDHWRHVWFLFGVVWGLAIATAQLHREAQPRAFNDPRLL